MNQQEPEYIKQHREAVQKQDGFMIPQDCINKLQARIYDPELKKEPLKHRGLGAILNDITKNHEEEKKLIEELKALFGK